MSNAQPYLDLKKKHEQELSDFPIAYAFNEQQLTEALEKLGVSSVKECCTVFNHGDIVKKEDARKLVEMFKRHGDELKDAMRDQEFVEGAFRYEMDNHEYAINWSADDDVLDCFSMKFEDLREMKLEDAYRRARNGHMKMMEELGVI